MGQRGERLQRKYLERRALSRDFGEADDVTEVDGRLFVIFSWHFLRLLELPRDARRKHLKQQHVALPLFALQFLRLLRQIARVDLIKHLITILWAHIAALN